MDHQAVTTARQILTVLGIDLDQVPPCAAFAARRP
jgi:hypothetical protein